MHPRGLCTQKISKYQFVKIEKNIFNILSVAFDVFSLYLVSINKFLLILYVQ